MTGDREELLARLAERGLIRTGVIDLPAEEAAESAETSGAPPSGGHQRRTVRPADERDELGSVTIGCPGCHHRQNEPLSESKFRCDHCRVRWAWAICRSCRLLVVVDEDIPAWKCTGCEKSNRSWWFAEEGNDAIKVAAERRRLAAEREQERVRQGIRRRAKKMIASLATLVFVVLGGLLVFAVSGPASDEQVAGGVCRHYATLRSDISNGKLDRKQIQVEMAKLAERAEAATADVQAAAALAAEHSGNVASVEFKRAMTDFEDACAAAGF